MKAFETTRYKRLLFLLCWVFLVGLAQGQTSQGMAACEQATWFAPNPLSFGGFGFSVAVSSDTALVSAAQEAHRGVAATKAEV